MRVIKRVSDDKILEGQSNDNASFDALIENMYVNGYAPGSFYTLIMPDADFHAAIKQQNENIRARDKALGRIPKTKEELLEERIAALEAKLKDK